ncbi:MAG: cation transporter [Spirochaetaceae bacterium]|nr:cation transporter [Spirochaetaceae bacterium]
MTENNREKVVLKISIISIVINIVLSIFKFFAGIFGHSAALISDAIHSASDVFSTVIVIIGVKISGKAADASHQYGHERYESLAAILLSILLALTGLAIGYEGIKNIMSKEYLVAKVPTLLTVIAAITSIIVKELMYWYTRDGAKKIKSDILMADAWHHRSDALSSIGSLIGVVGARAGYMILDPLAAILICLLIIKVALSIFNEGTDKMVDSSLSSEITDSIKKEILSTKGVIVIDSIKTRKFGDKAYVDVEISVYGELTLLEAHDIAVEVHNKIEKAHPNVKHCMVHVNPYVT